MNKWLAIKQEQIHLCLLSRIIANDIKSEKADMNIIAL